MKCWSFY